MAEQRGEYMNRTDILYPYSLWLIVEYPYELLLDSNELKMVVWLQNSNNMVQSTPRETLACHSIYIAQFFLSRHLPSPNNAK
jgi:hypothetical protein